MKRQLSIWNTKRKKGNIWDWIDRTREEKIVKEIIFEEIISKTW